MTRGTRRVALLFALLSLAAFAAVGGDEALTQPKQQPMPLTQPMPLAVKVGGFLGLQHYLDCPKAQRGALLRLQVAHKPDAWPVRVECAYGPAFPRGAI